VSVWEQEKLEATLREMLAVGAAREASHTACPATNGSVEGSGERLVGQGLEDSILCHSQNAAGKAQQLNP
jgi:hypothetical protein